VNRWQANHDRYATHPLASRAATRLGRRRLAYQVLEDRVLFSVAVTPTAPDWPTEGDLEFVLAPCAETSEWNLVAANGLVVEDAAPADVAPPETASAKEAEPPSLTAGDWRGNVDAVPCNPREDDSPPAGGDSLGLQNNPLDSASERTETGEPRPSSAPSTVAAALERLIPSHTVKSTGAASAVRHEAMSSVAGAEPRMLDIGREVEARSAGWRGVSPWGLVGETAFGAPERSQGAPPTAPLSQDDTLELQRGFEDYFQRLGELPAVDASVRHTAARDDFDSFVLGSQPALPPPPQIDDWTAASARPAAAPTSSPNESFVSMSVPAERLPPETAADDEPPRDPRAAPGRQVVAEAGIWPLVNFPPGRLLRAACVVGIASGVIIRRSKANGCRASE
jgi:hypothetical protein